MVPLDGSESVLKLSPVHTEALHEAEGLRFWDGDGCVRLHAAASLGEVSALVLERCSPGTPLGEALPEPEQDVVVAGLLRRLWRPAGSPFRPLWQMCDFWADGFDRWYAAEPVIDAGLARAGVALFRSLPRDAVENVLLSTDLHGGNILAAAREPWLVIDPKPYVGDPCYDVLQHMLNCSRLESDPLGLADRMAALAGLDRDRVRRWLFARCVLESLERPELRAVAARIAP